LGLVGAPSAARTHVASLALSPAGTQVALAAVVMMVSGEIAAAATRSYTPTAIYSAAPVWLPDGSGFLVGFYTGSTPNIYQYNVSGGLAGVVVHANAPGADALP
jgi:hypothetical protein